MNFAIDRSGPRSRQIRSRLHTSRGVQSIAHRPRYVHRRLDCLRSTADCRNAGGRRCEDWRLVLVPACPLEAGACRKPAPGLFFAGARREWVLYWRKSWVVGDRLSDLRAGRQVGARAILVATGYGESEYALPEHTACVDYFVPTLRGGGRRDSPRLTPTSGPSRPVLPE